MLDIGLFLLPEWLKLTLLPALGVSPYQIATGVFKGILDSFLVIVQQVYPLYIDFKSLKSLYMGVAITSY
ncbi:MAG: hypothetical protein ACI9EW_000448 [Cellvibrionaceae bacterium]|jgi:hypothetical protein